MCEHEMFACKRSDCASLAPALMIRCRKTWYKVSTYSWQHACAGFISGTANNAKKRTLISCAQEGSHHTPCIHTRGYSQSHTPQRNFGLCSPAAAEQWSVSLYIDDCTKGSKCKTILISLPVDNCGEFSSWLCGTYSWRYQITTLTEVSPFVVQYVQVDHTKLWNLHDFYKQAFY